MKIRSNYRTEGEEKRRKDQDRASHEEVQETLALLQPDCDFCSKCREHTGFEQVDGEYEWLSVCCGAPPFMMD